MLLFLNLVVTSTLIQYNSTMENTNNILPNKTFLDVNNSIDSNIKYRGHIDKRQKRLVKRSFHYDDIEVLKNKMNFDMNCINEVFYNKLVKKIFSIILSFPSFHEKLDYKINSEKAYYYLHSFKGILQDFMENKDIFYKDDKVIKILINIGKKSYKLIYSVSVIEKSSDLNQSEVLIRKFLDTIDLKMKNEKVIQVFDQKKLNSFVKYLSSCKTNKTCSIKKNLNEYKNEKLNVNEGRNGKLNLKEELNGKLNLTEELNGKLNSNENFNNTFSDYSYAGSKSTKFINSNLFYWLIGIFLILLGGISGLFAFKYLRKKNVEKKYKICLLKEKKINNNLYK